MMTDIYEPLQTAVQDLQCFEPMFSSGRLSGRRIKELFGEMIPRRLIERFSELKMLHQRVNTMNDDEPASHSISIAVYLVRSRYQLESAITLGTVIEPILSMYGWTQLEQVKISEIHKSLIGKNVYIAGQDRVIGGRHCVWDWKGAVRSCLEYRFELRETDECIPQRIIVIPTQPDGIRLRFPNAIPDRN